MPLSEFELIARYFRQLGALRQDVVLGVGDDAALLRVPSGCELVAAIDTLIEGVHFPPGSPPASIGHRALAVNLSDLAAMGATPAWALLALTLPRPGENWLQDFARGFGALALEHGIALVGGDTTAGALSITVQVLGFAPQGQAIRRSGAKPGDLLCVSGTPGDAAEGLDLEMHGSSVGADAATAAVTAAAATTATDRLWLRNRFLYPTPRVALGLALRGIGSACIDVSDGLFADAGKLAAASGCAASIDADALPLSAALLSRAGREGAVRRALLGGDDYELCFTVSPDRLGELDSLRDSAGAPAFHRIGQLHAGSGIEARRHGTVMDVAAQGFDHFRRS